ncbi:MAG TPA: CbiX/SirB N-terminal domain-containing protein [Candidatus Dormibacteraeota bacterium]|nr:CbiX/SirB N-terminal domain-containing protein [Candidatus Dormibacteraeota bacterium]
MRPGLLLLAHGTRSGSGLAALRDLAASVAAARPGLPLALGVLEFPAPSVPAVAVAAADLAARGVTEIVLVPLLLFPAGHRAADLPRVAAGIRRAHPGVSLRVTPILGPSPQLRTLAVRRAREAMGAERPPDAVCVVGRGSSVARANGLLAHVVRDVGRCLGRPAAGAFVSLAEPGVPPALGALVAAGHRRLLTVPFFLTEGRLVDRIERQAAEFCRTARGVEVRCAAPLGPDAAVVAAVWRRAAAGGLDRPAGTVAGLRSGAA